MDSAVAVRLAVAALREQNSLLPFDSAEVHSFERDTAGVTISILPMIGEVWFRRIETDSLDYTFVRFGGGGLVRVSNAGKVTILEDYQ